MDDDWGYTHFRKPPYGTSGTYAGNIIAINGKLEKYQSINGDLEKYEPINGDLENMKK